MSINISNVAIIVRPQGQVSLDTGRFEWIRSPVELFTPLRWAVSSITWIIMVTLSHSTSAWMTITTLSGTRNTPSVSGGTVRCVGSPTTRRMMESHSTCHRRQLSPRSGPEPGRQAAPLTSSPSMTHPTAKPMVASALILWVMSGHQKSYSWISHHRHSQGQVRRRQLSINSADSAAGDWTVTLTPPPTLSSTPQSSPLSFRSTWMALNRRTIRTGASVSTTDR